MENLNESPVRFGVLLSLVAMLFGFVLGGVFGAAEDGIKGSLKDAANGVLQTVYKGDQAAADKVSSKSWSYYKRAHMHAGAMGTAALLMCLLLAATTAKAPVKLTVSLMVAIGSIGYPVYWLMAANRAPAMGSTGAAKESLDWLAIPTSGAFIVGTVAVIVLFALRCRWGKTKPG